MILCLLTVLIWPVKVKLGLVLFDDHLSHLLRKHIKEVNFVFGVRFIVAEIQISGYDLARLNDIYLVNQIIHPLRIAFVIFV